MLLALIDVDLTALRTQVVRAKSDDDVAVWLRANADVSQYERANTALCEFRHEDIPPDEQAHFESLYPEYLRSRYPVAFDLLEADDRELYPDLGKW
jgi:hypothetical protein